MAIRSTRPVREIIKEIEAGINNINNAVIYNLHYIGERVRNEAIRNGRGKKNYKDRTGNLRSSIGYVIIENGNVVDISHFGRKRNKKDGEEAGKRLALELAKQYTKGYALIVVAGMEYAAYVANKGYDVLDSAELLADEIAPKILKRLKL